MKGYSNGKRKCSTDQETGTRIAPKTEIWDFDVLSQTMFSRHMRENVASTSGSKVKSTFVEMGFASSLVDKVLVEKGENNADIILETLITYSALQKSECDSENSLDELFGDTKNGSGRFEFQAECHPKKEPDVYIEWKDGKRESLLGMHFSVAEIEFAMDKLGKDAEIFELVDFIVAVQLAATSENDADDPTQRHRGIYEAANPEALYGTMDITLQLLQLGFSENDISLAIEKLGSDTSISVLADAIFSGQLSDTCIDDIKHPISSLHNFQPKGEEYCMSEVSYLRRMHVEEARRSKKPKQEYMYDSAPEPTWLRDIKPKLNGHDGFRFIPPSKPKILDKAANGPPYFVYGNISDVSRNTWSKMSQFLHAIDPEYANTRLFSALNRQEGYIHNLPTENRSHIIPKPPMTIQDTILQSKEWWPKWDTRKYINSTNLENGRMSEICDRLGKILTDSLGALSAEQESEILDQCSKWNLIWVGQYKVGPIEPEHVEIILGYPPNHTKSDEFSREERLKCLKQGFQTDTLGYHLSVLKPMFSGGMTVLSLYSGVGGVEITLHRLGIHMKGVVSVECCEKKRKILKRWWSDTRQNGELVQIGEIDRLTNRNLEELIKRFGGFDVVICQNPWAHSINAYGDGFSSLDFSMFCEFVRVLKGVRIIMGKNR